MSIAVAVRTANIVIQRVASNTSANRNRLLLLSDFFTTSFIPPSSKNGVEKSMNSERIELGVNLPTIRSPCLKINTKAE